MFKNCLELISLKVLDSIGIDDEFCAVSENKADKRVSDLRTANPNEDLPTFLRNSLRLL
jgi:hypothetical protein